MKEKASQIAKENDKYLSVLKEEYNLSPMLLALRLVKPKTKVLSVGCGAGREASYVVKELNCNLTGIDYDPEMIKSSKIAESHAEYLCQDALQFTRPNSYDFVLCLWNTINFLNRKERKKLIEVSYKNLKQGGKLILTTSHIFHHWRFPLHNLKHRTTYYYSPSQIKYWFKDSNFKVEKIRVGHCNLILATK